MTKGKTTAARGAHAMKVVLSPEEQVKAKARAAKFGVVSDADKLKQRHARFNEDPAANDSKRLARAQRFAAKLGGSLNPEEDLEKRKKRAERFGVVTPEAEEERKKRRRERFRGGDKAQDTINLMNAYLAHEHDDAGTTGEQDVSEDQSVQPEGSVEGTASAPFQIDAPSS